MGETFQKQKFSESTDGMAILVVKTSTPGDLIHTAISSVAINEFHSIWLWVVNSSASEVKLTIEYGAAAAKDQIEFTIPAEDGLYAVLPGLILQNAKEVRAFAGTANVLNIHGFIQQISNA